MSNRTKSLTQDAHPVDGQALPEQASAAHSAAGAASRSDRDRIAQRAYELYLARGGTEGLADDDWFTAEREISGSSGREEHS
jgi:hypothetical protein